MDEKPGGLLTSTPREEIAMQHIVIHRDGSAQLAERSRGEGQRDVPFDYVTADDTVSNPSSNPSYFGREDEVNDPLPLVPPEMGA